VSNPDLASPRYRAILESIISQYIETVSPVGSRAVAAGAKLNISPATIRNIMADLEEMGYLMQPHTSAGRIPTDKGYRYYVDVLMEVQRITQEEQERIRHEYENRQKEINDVLRVTTRLLSLMTRKPGLITAPKKGNIKLRHLELVSLTQYRLLAVLVFQSGVVENIYVDLDEEVTAAEIEWLQNVINHHGRGKNILHLAVALKKALAGEDHPPARQALLVVIVDTIMASLDTHEEVVFVDGASLLLEQPDFRNLGCIKEMLRTLENREKLREILRRDLNTHGAVVTIGNEIPVSDLRDCSVVTGQYNIGGQPMGALGIVGPTRLEYPKVIAIINHVSQVVSEILTEHRYE